MKFKCHICGSKAEFAGKNDREMLCAKHFRDYQIESTNSNNPYAAYLEKHSFSDGERYIEPAQANPDQFTEEDSPWLPRYSDYQRLKLDAIQNSFSVLSDLERRVITLIYTEGLTQDEISKRLKIGQPKISKALNSAKRKIKNIYEESRNILE